jgi:hypothetical protein
MEHGKALIGSWRLESFELQSGEGEISHPYGRELTGYLFYNEDGYMSAAFMNAARGRAADDASDSDSPPDNNRELAQAAQASNYDQFMSYMGPFEVSGDKITHYVEVSSLEAFVGSVQQRWFKIDGDRLELLTQALKVGSDAPVGRLAWRRTSHVARSA